MIRDPSLLEDSLKEDDACHQLQVRILAHVVALDDSQSSTLYIYLSQKSLGHSSIFGSLYCLSDLL